MTLTPVRDLLAELAREARFEYIVQRVRQEPNLRLNLSGLAPAAKAVYLNLLQRATGRQLLVVTDGNKAAESLHEAIRALQPVLAPSPTEAQPQLLPALDVLPHQRMSPHSELLEQRAIALWRLSTGNVPVTVTPIMAALMRTEGPAFYRQLALTLRATEEMALEDITAHLDSIGYVRQEPVEMVGEYSVRGGILDVFPAESEQPFRLEFFGDTVEEIRRFDPESQRSTLKVKEVTILPLLEHPKSRALFQELQQCLEEGEEISGDGPFSGWELLVPLVRPRTGSLLSLLQEPLIVWDEPDAIKGAAERFWTRLESTGGAACPPDRSFLTYDELLAQAAGRAQIGLRELDLLQTDGTETISIATRPVPVLHGNVRSAVAEAKSLVANGHQVVFFALALGEVERLADLFREYSVPHQIALGAEEQISDLLRERAALTGAGASITLTRGPLRKGVSFTESKLTLFGAEDLFASSDLVGTQPKGKSALAAFQTDIADLKEGDFVVHATHGIGRYLGLKTIPQDGSTADFMVLEYSGSSKLYVPLTRLDLVQKFRGAGEGSPPPLDRMGGVTWAKTKSRVKAKMRDMADELLKLYAQRKVSQGFAFSPDSNWQREFEDAFEYSATRDQLEAVRQIKRDMESATPMDRLLCGDVGFGKTEVAMRSAFKALGDGKQVAVLAPTTVLALQHFETFKRRFASFPVRIEMLSRLRPEKELKAIVEDINTGKVDIIVGTHRVLSKDVQYKDLGLLIIDEEQRFGVRHKEALKQYRKNLDVLTMSATPIPRTLHMSLLGLRDLSVIETPPKDRLAVHTVVAHFDQGLIKNAIEQEISRGGQVYFVHNRVETIFMRAASIQEMMPDLRIGVGHGRMGEAELERVLLGFMKHDFDVFVCTTIVENGLDIPQANTMVIENAERYGLSELYQLRGRVGRSNRRAYAYLLVPGDKELSEIARKRLAALKEFSDLGAGFKIAALDLELRGAGNILGGEQHGQIAAVGFDAYVRLLEETVHELRGEEVPLEVHSTLSLGLELRIPPAYIADEQQRLRAYKRIADAADKAMADKFLAELQDRYGPAPQEIHLLFAFSEVKSIAQQLGIENIDRRQGVLNVKFHQESRVNPMRLMELVQQTPGAQFTPAGVLRVPLGVRSQPGEVLEFLRTVLLRALSPGDISLPPIPPGPASNRPRPAR